MVDCVVTHRMIKGKIYAVMRDIWHKDDQVLAAEFSSIAQLKRVCKDAKIQYCKPKSYLIARNWVK